MKYVMAALLIFTLAASAFQAASLDLKVDKQPSWIAHKGTGNMEDKLLGALQDLSASYPAGASAAGKTASNGAILNNTSLNNSSELNSSAQNLSAANLSGVNLPAASLPGCSTDSQRLGSDSRGSMKGFYGIEASQQGFGKSGINSRMYLSGDFNVDKSVKFQDRNF